MPWLLAVAAGALLIGVGWLAYQRGQLSAGRDAAEESNRRRALEARTARLEAENTRLNAKVAELEMARKLDRDAYTQIERTLGDLQSQLARKSDDLAFYRSIVSPADGVEGLRIQRFEVVAGAKPREFVLKLTLVQAMRHENLISGLAQIEVNGMLGQRPVHYALGELVGRPHTQLPFSFRYFQTIEQAVSLPEGFQAFEADVEVRSNKLRAPLRQSFPWKVGGPGAL